jgi:hypothetical protein
VVAVVVAASSAQRGRDSTHTLFTPPARSERGANHPTRRKKTTALAGAQIAVVVVGDCRSAAAAAEGVVTAVCGNVGVSDEAVVV